MRIRISTPIKEFITKIAYARCEYCHYPDKVSFYSFHFDHIISLKHGGNSEIGNLAYSCPDCNLNKGTDLGTLNNEEKIIRFFNPRKDIWEDNFEIIDGIISGKTEVGIATEQILKFNEFERLILRRQLIELGQYSL